MKRVEGLKGLKGSNTIQEGFETGICLEVWIDQTKKRIRDTLKRLGEVCDKYMRCFTTAT